MAPPAASCQAIRLCSLDCADDACVAANCLPMGSTAAQAQFQMLHDCTKAAQPTGGGCATPNDVNCLCLAQCLQDPPCGELAMACTATIVDTICDNVVPLSVFVAFGPIRIEASGHRKYSWNSLSLRGRAWLGNAPLEVQCPRDIWFGPALASCVKLLRLLSFWPSG